MTNRAISGQAPLHSLSFRTPERDISLNPALIPHLASKYSQPTADYQLPTAN